MGIKTLQIFCCQNGIMLPLSKPLDVRRWTVNCFQKVACAFRSQLYPQLYTFDIAPLIRIKRKCCVWASINRGKSELPGNNSMMGATRLKGAFQDLQLKLNTKIGETKKGLPLKILFFLVGFYCATAFATVIGQTGDWDILSAGLAVVVVEGMGALMYKASFSSIFDKLKSLITMFNYWKAGLSLGLFLDAFKYEIDLSDLELSNPFKFEMNFFPDFW